MVFQGPHFYVGTPFNKEPNEGCRHNNDYSVVELETLADEFVPRTNYQLQGAAAERAQMLPRWREATVFDDWRLVARRRLPPTAERTLAACLVPPGLGTTGAVFNATFRELNETVLLTGLMWNVVYEECPQAEYTAIAMEYGTVPIQQVIEALRADHWLHLHPQADAALARSIKQQILDAFYVGTDDWRGQIVAQARQAMFQGVAGLTAGR